MTAAPRTDAGHSVTRHGQVIEFGFWGVWGPAEREAWERDLTRHLDQVSPGFQLRPRPGRRSPCGRGVHPRYGHGCGAHRRGVGCAVARTGLRRGHRAGRSPRVNGQFVAAACATLAGATAVVSPGRGAGPNRPERTSSSAAPEMPAEHRTALRQAAEAVVEQSRRVREDGATQALSSQQAVTVAIEQAVGATSSGAQALVEQLRRLVLATSEVGATVRGVDQAASDLDAVADTLGRLAGH